MRVFEERGPLAKTQIGGNERGALFVALLQQSEEQANLEGFGLGVTDLVNEDQIIIDIAADDLVLGPVGLGTMQFIEQIGKKNVAAPALVNGLDQKAGGQAGLAEPVPPSQMIFCLSRRKAMES